MQNSATVRRGRQRTGASFAPEARLLKALAHPERLAILANLRNHEACACHLAAILRRPRPYVSQQLTFLRRAGLVVGRREGTYIYYRLRHHAMLGLVDLASIAAGAPLRADVERPGGCGCPQCGSVRHARRATL